MEGLLVLSMDQVAMVLLLVLHRLMVVEEDLFLSRVVVKRELLDISLEMIPKDGILLKNLSVEMVE